jgi:hypothetical protein
MEENVVELFGDEASDSQVELAEWVIEKRNNWQDDYENNYEQDHQEYYRLWRAQWDPADKQRNSERSRLIAPALQQAVESSVAEMEEATFGRGKFFDIRDEVGDQTPGDVEKIKNKLMEDFDVQKIRKDVSECLINAAVFGTGIAEIVMEEIIELKPATRPVMDGEMKAFGVETTERLVVRLRPVQPKNFLIEPLSTSVENSIGVIINEYVPRHQVETLQDQGVYMEGDLGGVQPDTELMPDETDIVAYSDDMVLLTKYYGKVPKEYLSDSEDKGSRFVEAVVVIANDTVVLKASESPYMMKDRPVVAFPWDIIPGKFWGRGVCEKGYMSQKALDTELRARIDSLGLVAHPMLAMDATKMPRGFKPEVRPGKVILTNGNPAEVLMPFKFGNLDPNTFQQASNMQEMVQQATGAVDSTGLLSQVSGETKAGAVSMSLGAVIKRHKRTLINFQSCFLLPLVQKSAWRYMQFDPENYPVADWKFVPTSTLGIIAREYEVSQLISLLQTMSPDSPLYPTLIRAVVDNMNLSNRDEMLSILDQASQPTPEQQQQEQEQQALMKEKELAQIEVFKATADGERARSEKYRAQATAVPTETMAKLIQASMGDLQDDAEAKDFDRRLSLLDRVLKNKGLDLQREKANAGVKAPALPGPAALAPQPMPPQGVPQ